MGLWGPVLFKHHTIYPPPKTKKSMTELELEKQQTLHPLSWLISISCIQSFLIPWYSAFLPLFSSCYIVPTYIFVYTYIIDLMPYTLHSKSSIFLLMFWLHFSLEWNNIPWNTVVIVHYPVQYSSWICLTEISPPLMTIFPSPYPTSYNHHSIFFAFMIFQVHLLSC